MFRKFVIGKCIVFVEKCKISWKRKGVKKKSIEIKEGPAWWLGTFQACGRVADITMR